MRRREAAQLLALAAAYDRRTTCEVDDEAWADALGGLTVEECAEAIRAHYREAESWLMPSQIRRRVLEQRAARRQAEREAATKRELAEAAGFDREASQRAFAEFMAPVLAKIGRRTAEVEAAERRARTVRCPYCQAAAGSPCQTAGKPRDVAHPTRYDNTGGTAPVTVPDAQRGRNVGHDAPADVDGPVTGVGG